MQYKGIIIDALGLLINKALLIGMPFANFPMNLNKENIKGGAIIIIAWAFALSLVLLAVEKFKLLLQK